MTTFNSTDQMRLSKLSPGQLVETKGYDAPNDKGLATYLTMTALDYNKTPDEMSDFTLANGNIAVLQSLSDSSSAKSFGAKGDGVTDDSDALQAWANGGGNLFLPRGLYRVTKQIIFPASSTVTGENPGAGTGGSPLTELQQAQAGASIIRVSSDFVGTSVFKFVDLTFKHNASAVMSNFQILNDRLNGCQAHLLEIVNGYDLVDASNLNLMFAGPDANALRVVEDQTIDSASIGQTLKFSNIVGIHDDAEGTLVPTMHFRRQQEMQIIGVKSFGSPQAVTTRAQEAMWIEGCRGVTLIGCSVAITGRYGLRIFSNTRSSDGISITGMTYELCDSGGLFVDGSECDPAITVSKVYNLAPRYQFPQTIACVLLGGAEKNVINCEIDTGTAQTVIGNNVESCLIRGNVQSNVTDNSGNTSNLTLTVPNGLGDAYRSNRNFEIQQDSGSVKFITADGAKTYDMKYNANTANDFGFQLTNVTSGSYLLHEQNGKLLMQPSTLVGANGPQIEMFSPSGNKSITLAYSINFADADSGFFIKNNDTNSTAVFEPDGDLNLTPTTGDSAMILRSADGTAYRIRPANGGGSLLITAV